MLRWDERAVTVQIGAILLLAIVFTALALYQVNAVPAENGAIEGDHNRQVQGELQDLRNAIRNVGTGGGSASVSVTLGTQYPTRTFLTNPPDPTGTLETTGSANLSIENATVEGTYGGDGDPSALIGTHETTTLVYEPDYHEYRTAPTTHIEHGLAFNEFGHANLSLTEQPLISDGTIGIVLLDGELSESGRRAVSLDPTALSGPTDPVTITDNESAGNVTITIPTATPAVWNESIGSTFDTGESAARVTGYENGSLRIELADRDEYELRMARVGIGDDGEPSDEFDITAGSGATGAGAYDVYWTDNHDNVRQCDSDATCDYKVYAEETATFRADVSVEAATLDFAYDPGSPTVTTFDERASEVDFQADGSGYVDLFVSSGGGSDAITVLVEATAAPPSIDRFDVTSENHNRHARFTVDWEATAGDAGITRGTVELIDSTGSVVDTWEATYDNATSVTETGIGLEDKQGAGNEYDIRLTVTDSNGNSNSETVTRTA